MKDLLLNSFGDIVLNESGDISLTESIKQRILTQLRWIKGEWRLGPEFGFPWFEVLLVKNPQFEQIKRLLQDEIRKIDGVQTVKITEVVYDKKSRKARFRFECTIDGKTINEEVTLDV